MPQLVAVDVAVLPPPDVSRLAIDMSARLPEAESQGLRLDRDHLPHITLTQNFVRAEELALAMERIEAVVATCPPLALRVSGGGMGSHSVWMAIERSLPLVTLHEQLMEALRGVERPGATKAAFFDEDARPRDVLWVSSYRLTSSFGAYTPHITLGHAEQPPAIEPFDFEATTVAACHLGRFCSCRRVLRDWTLGANPA